MEGQRTTGFSFGVDGLGLLDGTVVSPPANGMTVFIGPNNSGKSILLREVAALVLIYPGGVRPRRWVAGVNVQGERAGQWPTARGSCCFWVGTDGHSWVSGCAT
ncbi:hypothetical protein [Kitasatospora cineracea]|uniref:hypothetical protein n=1 Tax=Kitasatospora cineracea TaxID=88074 RepID=UPI0037A415E9